MRDNKAIRVIKIIAMFVTVGALIWLAFLLWQAYGPRPPAPEPISHPEPIPLPKPAPEPEPESEPEPEQQLHTILYEIGKFGPDAERKTYVSGTIILTVPRMNYNGPVMDGTDNATLNEGPGLFEQAQLPGTENRNVSIAAHRDIYGKEFWDIDKMTTGDLMYLTYNGKRYTYEFEDSFITTYDDWDPIRTKDYSCITLQSCTPINVASHRIFVVGRLIQAEDWDEADTGQ